MKVLKDKRFWIGVVAGTVFGQVALRRVAPQVSAKLPS